MNFTVIVDKKPDDCSECPFSLNVKDENNTNTNVCYLTRREIPTPCPLVEAIVVQVDKDDDE